MLCGGALRGCEGRGAQPGVGGSPHPPAAAPSPGSARGAPGPSLGRGPRGSSGPGPHPRPGAVGSPAGTRRAGSCPGRRLPSPASPRGGSSGEPRQGQLRWDRTDGAGVCRPTHIPGELCPEPPPTLGWAERGLGTRSRGHRWDWGQRGDSGSPGDAPPRWDSNPTRALGSLLGCPAPGKGTLSPCQAGLSCRWGTTMSPAGPAPTMLPPTPRPGDSPVTAESSVSPWGQRAVRAPLGSFSPRPPPQGCPPPNAWENS